MFELKSLTREAIPAALEKAHRYRLLNEPEQAESICEDVLRIDPDNQDALATLILALTDRFARPAAGVAAARARPAAATARRVRAGVLRRDHRRARGDRVAAVRTSRGAARRRTTASARR